MANLAHDLAAGRVSQVPKDAFAVGKDLACTPGKVVYRSPLMEIMQYAPSTGKVHAVPMLMVPPWINKYYVMRISDRITVMHLGEVLAEGAPAEIALNETVQKAYLGELYSE